MAPSPLPSISFDSSDLPRPQQFALWRDTLGGTHDVELPDGRQLTDGFRAEATLWHCGETLMADTRSDAQLLRRAPRRIRADQIDHYALRLHRAGEWAGEVDGRVVRAEAGDVMLLDLARPTKSRTSASHHFTVMLPREALAAAKAPEPLHGMVLRRGIGVLLGDWLASLARSLPQVQAAQMSSLLDVTRTLVVASVAPSRDVIEQARPALQSGLIAQISRVIERDLCSPELSPRSICRALGLSRSSLYRACEARGGVAAMIKQARLSRINTILSDPDDARRIFEIAHSHGFVSETHFSREFRRAFGCSPSDAREAAVARRMAPRAAARNRIAAIEAIWERQLRA